MNDASKTLKRKINRIRFLKSIFVNVRIRLLDTLGTCQINKRNFAASNFICSVVFGLNHNAKNKVRSARQVVHLSRVHLALPQAHIECLKSLLHRHQRLHFCVLNVNHIRIRILSNLQLVLV